MASRKRALLEPTDDWQQLQFHLDWPEQTRYELIRPVVVFGSAPVERAKQTGVSASTIYRKVSRFDATGMQSLFEAEPVEDKRALPPAYRQAIVQLKAEYPPFRPNELATICQTRFERRPSRATIKKILKKILATEPRPVEVVRRFPRYAEMTDPVERRGAILRLHAEGWNNTSIGGYLGTTRRRAYETLKRWWDEGPNGLEDKAPIPHQAATKSTLWAMNEVRKLQQNPELGAFRIHTALKQLGIHLSTRTCGRILARNRKLYGLRGHEAKPREPKPMPFKAHWRHEYWTVDVRYLDHQLGGGNIYSITILDNYSRFIVGSVISRTQNLRAYLHVLLSAVTEYGAPQAVVRDGGAIFKANGAMAVYQALAVTTEQIAPRQAWQSYIETCFNVQRRMADYHFARATTWDELLQRHAAWVHDYNSREHWAHLKRQDGRRSPAEVLDQVTGREFSDPELARIFAPLLTSRRVDQQGYVRFRSWRLYGERGLAGEPASIWVTDEDVTIQFADGPLATDDVKYQRDHRHFRQVTPKQIFETRHGSPQPPLLELGPDDWLLAIEQPSRFRRRRRRSALMQAALFSADEAVAGL
jgi:transposase InsO family protein/transposase